MFSFFNSKFLAVKETGYIVKKVLLESDHKISKIKIKLVVI